MKMDGVKREITGKNMIKGEEKNMIREGKKRNIY